MKPVFCAATSLFFAIITHAQSATENFLISAPSIKTSNSLYRIVRLVDARADKRNFGIVQLGAFNKKARVITDTPLDLQLSHVMEAMTDSTAQKGELILLLRQFNLAEVTGAFSERGYCHFRAVLFSKKSEGYQKLESVDTVIVVKAMDVTKGLLKQGSKALTDLLMTNLNKAPSDSIIYSEQDVVNFDNLEKRSLPLYTSASYKDGIYKNFDAFLHQIPNVEAFEVEFSKDNKPSVIKERSEKGKEDKVPAKAMYAFVVNGQPYITTDFGYYPLAKRENDFYFTGRAKVPSNSNDVMVASMFFGVIGALVASNPSNAVFEMKIDHLTGGFVRIREVK